MRLGQRNRDRLFDDDVDAALDRRHRRRVMMLVIGRDGYRVHFDRAQHLRRGREGVFDPMLLGGRARSRDIDIADGDERRLFDRRESVGVGVANAAAANEPEANLFRQRLGPPYSAVRFTPAASNALESTA